jgi:ABC-type dipeptide/oligopeptide/nickel transport system ATPase component
MELTNEEKINIVMQHIKSIASNIYNLQISLISENAIDPINQDNMQSLNTQLSIETSKMEALESELANLKG